MSSSVPSVGVHAMDFTLFDQQEFMEIHDLDPILSHLFGLSFQDFRDLGKIKEGKYYNPIARKRKYEACYAYKNLINVYFKPVTGFRNISRTVHFEVKGSAFDCGIADFYRLAEFISRNNCNLCNWHVYYDVPEQGRVKFERLWKSATATPHLLTSSFSITTRSSNSRSIIFGGVSPEPQKKGDRRKKSEKSLIIYERDDVIRMEMRLADGASSECFLRFCGGTDLNILVRSLISAMVVFRDPKGTDTNMSRRKPDPVWMKLFDQCKPLKLPARRSAAESTEEMEMEKICSYLVNKLHYLPVMVVTKAYARALARGANGIDAAVIDYMQRLAN